MASRLRSQDGSPPKNDSANRDTVVIETNQNENKMNKINFLNKEKRKTSTQKIFDAAKSGQCFEVEFLGQKLLCIKIEDGNMYNLVTGLRWKDMDDPFTHETITPVDIEVYVIHKP